MYLCSDLCLLQPSVIGTTCSCPIKVPGLVSCALAMRAICHSMQGNRVDNFSSRPKISKFGASALPFASVDRSECNTQHASGRQFRIGRFADFMIA